jgi:hypothetical protein
MKDLALAIALIFLASNAQASLFHHKKKDAKAAKAPKAKKSDKK